MLPRLANSELACFSFQSLKAVSEWSVVDYGYFDRNLQSQSVSYLNIWNLTRNPEINSEIPKSHSKFRDFEISYVFLVDANPSANYDIYVVNVKLNFLHFRLGNKRKSTSWAAVLDPYNIIVLAANKAD